MKAIKFTPAIKLDRNSVIPLCAQIVEQFRQEIIRERPAPGLQIISERQLSAGLQVNRETVHQAYGQLSASGLLESRGLRGSGMAISKDAVQFYRQPFPALTIILPYKFSEQLQMASRYGLEMIANLMDRAAEMQVSVNLTPMPPMDAAPDTIEKWLDSFLPRSIGIITLGCRSAAGDMPFEALLQFPALPHLFINGKSRLPHISTLVPNIPEGAREMGQCFRSLGHRRAAVIGLFGGSVSCFESFSGYRGAQVAEALKKCGLDVSAIPLNLKELDFEKTADQLLALHPRPTAVWVQNDDMALQLIAVLRSRGFSVPEDFSIVGFDNSNNDSELSSLDYSRSKTGKQAVEIISRLFEHGSRGEAVHHRIPCHFIQRKSVGFPCLERKKQHDE